MQINEYLSEQNIPAAQFARQIKVLKQTFFKYVHGIAFPPPSVLKRIAEATDGKVTANDFVEQHTNKRPSEAAE
jgi:transcriptional regulator with XRE-family HTH domain